MHKYEGRTLFTGDNFQKHSQLMLLLDYIKYMRRFFFALLLVYVLFSGTEAFAATVVTDNITSHTVWSAANSPYIIQNNIEIAAGSQLSIEAGTVVKLFDGVSLFVSGNLDIAGDNQDYVFLTSIHDDTVAGDTNANGASTTAGTGFQTRSGWRQARWNTIHFLPGAVGTISYAHMRHGGGHDFSDYFPNIENNGATLTINNSHLTDARLLHIKHVSGAITVQQSHFSGGSAAVGILGGIATLEDNHISHVDYGLLIESDGSVHFSRNNFAHSYAPISLWLKRNTSLSYEGNILQNNHFNGVLLQGPVAPDVVLDNQSLPYVVTGVSGDNALTRNLGVERTSGLGVLPDASLTLERGTVLKIEEITKLTVEGTLRLHGAPGAPVIVTSLYDNEIGGPIWSKDTRQPNQHRWGTVDIKSDAVVAAVHAVLRYSGENRFFPAAFFHNQGGQLTVEWSQAEKIFGTLVMHKGGASTVTYSNFYDSLFGIQNFTTDIVNATNNYWGDASGPAHSTNPAGVGRAVTDFVSFTPWATEPVVYRPAEELGPSSILFLPGIKASRLYTKNMFGFEDQLWTPNNNGDIRQLGMTEAGNSLNTVYTKDIIDNVLGLGSVYGEISAFFDELVVAGNIQNWQSFAYDWRYAVDDIVTYGTQYEYERRYVLELIEQLATDSFSGQVTIIAHSNGGLLAKALLTELEAQGKSHMVDSLILLASPQLGTPKAIGTILHGYDEDILAGLIVRAGVAREVTRNMPAVYGLLPTKEYFDATAEAPVVLFADNLPVDFASHYGSNIIDSATLDDFVAGRRDDRAEAVTVYEAAIGHDVLLQKTRNLHNTVLQPWRAPDHMSVIEVAGIGLPTIHSFAYRSYKTLECSVLSLLQPCALVDIYKPVPRFSLLGDETVMAASAVGYRGEKEVYYLNLGSIKEQLPRIKHHNFTEFNDVQNFVSNVVLNESEETPFITQDRLLDTESYVLFGIHSPVVPTIKATDGTIATVRVTDDLVEIIEDIPGSSVYYFGDTTYIVLPAEETYDVSLEGTGAGVVTLEVDYLATDTDQRLEQRLFIPDVATSSLMRTRLAASSLEDVLVDVNNDGFFDYRIDAGTNEKILLKDDVEDVGAGNGKGLAKRKSPTVTSRALPLPPVAGVATGSGATMDIKQVSELLAELKIVLEAYEKATRQ